VIERKGDQSYTVEISDHKRILVHLDKMKATGNVPEEILVLHFATENEAEQRNSPSAYKVMGNREDPHGMGVVVQLMSQPSNENTWVDLQNLAGLPPLLENASQSKKTITKAKDKQKALSFCQARGFKHQLWISQMMLELHEWANPGAPCSNIPYISLFLLHADSHYTQAT